MGTLIFIPTYNESNNIALLVKRILESYREFSILIVDDNSPDGTGKIADQLAHTYDAVKVLHRPRKEGLGPAYIEGFKYAMDNGFASVLTMDADLSHDPKYLKDFLAASGEHDLIIGSRYLKGIGVLHWSLMRVLLSLFANNYVRLITGLPLRDCTSGFVCFKTKVLKAIDLGHIRSNGYAFDVEIKYLAWCNHFKITEIPIVFLGRKSGDSKMSLKDIIEAVIMPWRLRFRRPSH